MQSAIHDPVEHRKRMAGNPNWIDKWSPADCDLLVEKREVERKKWIVIADEMSRPLASCYRRYAMLNRDVPSIMVEKSIPRIPLHQQLGIETYVHCQAITDYVGGFDKDSGQYFSPHLYRKKVTLAKVFASYLSG